MLGAPLHETSTKHQGLGARACTFGAMHKDMLHYGIAYYTWIQVLSVLGQAMECYELNHAVLLPVLAAARHAAMVYIRIWVTAFGFFQPPGLVPGFRTCCTTGG